MKTRLKMISQFFNYFCSHPYIRAKVLKIRFLYFSKIRGIRFYDTGTGEHLKPKLISHNLSAFENISVDFSMRRMNMLISALTAIEKINTNSKILIIGPRTENDIFILRGLGFLDIQGLDLISYSPLIQLGDMHNIPFSDNTFDAVICGWTISYSTNPSLAAAEMVRVLKNGGLIALGLEHVIFENEINKPRDSHLVDLDRPSDRVNSCEDLANLFNSVKLEIYFNHNAPLRKLLPSSIEKITGLCSSQVMFVAGINKAEN